MFRPTPESTRKKERETDGREEKNERTNEDIRSPRTSIGQATHGQGHSYVVHNGGEVMPFVHRSLISRKLAEKSRVVARLDHEEFARKECCYKESIQQSQRDVPASRPSITEPTPYRRQVATPFIQHEGDHCGSRPNDSSVIEYRVDGLLLLVHFLTCRIRKMTQKKPSNIDK